MPQDSGAARRREKAVETRRVEVARRATFETWFDAEGHNERRSHCWRTSRDLWNRFQGFRERQATYHRHAFHDVETALAQLGMGNKANPSQKFKPLDPTEERSIFISEWIRTRADSLVNRLTRGKHVVVPIESPLWAGDSETLETMVKAGLGVLNMIDQAALDRMYGATHDLMMKNSLVYTGKVIQRVQVTKNEDTGYADFDVEILDPYYAAHDVGAKKVRRFVYRTFYERNAIEGEIHELGGVVNEEIKQLLGESGGESSALFAMTEYWEEMLGSNKEGKMVPIVYYGHFLSKATGDDIQDGLPIYPEVLRRDKAWGRIPIVIQARAANYRIFSSDRLGGLGSATGNADTMTRSFLDHHAEPFFAPAIQLEVQMNQLLALEKDAAALNTLKPTFDQKADGSKTSILNRGNVFPGASVAGEPGDRVTPLDLTGPQFGQSRPIAELKEQQEGIYPSILLAPQSFAGESGHHLNSQIDHAKNFLVPWVLASQSAKAGMLNEVFYQLRSNGDLEAMVYGIDHAAEDPQSRFMIVFSGADLPEGGNKLFDIEEPPEIPGDGTQQATLFDSLTRSGAVSRRTGRRLLHMQDPVAEEKRIEAEQVKQHPAMININVLEEFAKRAEEAKEALQKATSAGAGPKVLKVRRLALRAARRALAAKEQELLGPPPGQGTPQGPAGIDPSVAPPETVGPNPDQQAEAQGRPNAPTEGRPRPPGTP